MSEKYEPKKGDRVRVSCEGIVVAAWAEDKCITLDNGWDVGLCDSAISVERIPDPLPTTADSVIRSKVSGSVWHLHTDGSWHAADGTISPGWYRPENFDVIYDAGAVK